MNNKPKLPILMDVDDFFNHLKLLKEIDNVGYLDIEITSKKILKKLKIPEKLVSYFHELKIPPEEFVNTVLRHFVIQMFEGDEIYNQFILKKIQEAPIDILNRIQKIQLIKYLNKDDE